MNFSLILIHLNRHRLDLSQRSEDNGGVTSPALKKIQLLPLSGENQKLSRPLVVCSDSPKQAKAAQLPDPPRQNQNHRVPSTNITTPDPSPIPHARGGIAESARAPYSPKPWAGQALSSLQVQTQALPIRTLLHPLREGQRLSRISGVQSVHLVALLSEKPRGLRKPTEKEEPKHPTSQLGEKLFSPEPWPLSRTVSRCIVSAFGQMHSVHRGSNFPPPAVFQRHSLKE
ncbi:uncharacterized protein LOC114817165 [Ornithorhynchus anatinus]|uniref:uncharacterized protein LOC114817165 n=1 Tax=Ornithorhynchus anatinus TaxID=9258 RepID=UPI0010A80823|nr:uncharacterized protein LOC114817165 [Ornithorhynchus anatinus]